MKRVCFLLNNEFLMDNRVEREARTLVDAGYSLTLFCSANRETARQENRAGIQIRRIFPQRLHSYKPFSFRLVKAVYRILTSTQRFDIVHAHDCNMLLLGWLLARIWGAKLVYDSHELWESVFSERKQGLHSETEHRSRVNLDRMIRLERKILPQCDRVITVNQSIGNRLDELRTSELRTNELRSGHARPLKETLVIRNISGFYSLPAEQTHRRYHKFFNLRPEQKVILLQGGLRVERGVFKMIEAMAQVRNPDLVLVLMGPAMAEGFHDELRESLQQNPLLPERVFYKEPVYGNELLPWTASADLGVSPILNTRTNNYFSLPNKLFEYVQAEIPCATSNFPEMAAIVEEYQLGFTFDPEDTQGLAQKLDDFFADPKIAKFHRTQARQAKKVLNWEVEQKKLLQLYQEVL
jgi:glycosyltransferase involved in cell wall biosynthesis